MACREWSYVESGSDSGQDDGGSYGRTPAPSSSLRYSLQTAATCAPTVHVCWDSQYVFQTNCFSAACNHTWCKSPICSHSCAVSWMWLLSPHGLMQQQCDRLDPSWNCSQFDNVNVLAKLLQCHGKQIDIFNLTANPAWVQPVTLLAQSSTCLFQVFASVVCCIQCLDQALSW